MKHNRKKKTIEEVIAERLEKSNDIPWNKPWKHANDICNHFSGRSYTGINRLLLPAGEYATFLDLQKRGFRLPKGSKGVTIFKPKPYKLDEDKYDLEEGDDGIRLTFDLLTVFDVQLVGLEYKHNKIQRTQWENDEELYNDIMNKAKEMGVTIEFVDGSSQAYYNVLQDKIVMPVMNQFKGKAEFYSTLLHELGHATGAPSRLNRIDFSWFGDENYSKEELVAEIFAFALCNDYGISVFESEENSMAYLKAWKKKLKGNENWLKVASSKAEKAIRLFYNEIDVKQEDQFFETAKSNSDNRVNA